MRKENLWKRKWNSILVLGIVLVMLAACGEKNSAVNQTAHSTDAEKEQESPVETQTETGETPVAETEAAGEAESEESPSPEGPVITEADARERFVAPDPEKLQWEALLSSGVWQFDLYDPVTAVEQVLDLEGGSGVYQRGISAYRGGEEGYVTYTFADGSHIVYKVANGAAFGLLDEDMWFPSYVVRQEEEEVVSEMAQICAYLENATAERLREVRKTPETPMWEMRDATVEDKFFLLGKDTNADIALFALKGYCGMVLQSGEYCYPIYRMWYAQYGIPNFYAADYDGDGQKEVAIISDQGGGTGFYSEALSIIEITENGLEMQYFGDEAMYEQTERIGYLWDEQRKTAQLSWDGENIGAELELEEVLEGLVFREIYFGDQMKFECREGQWHLVLSGGMLTEGHGQPNYELLTIHLDIPLTYTEEGFEIGEVIMEAKIRSTY